MTSHKPLPGEKDSEEILLTPEEVGDMLSVDSKHVYYLARLRGLPHVRLSPRKILIPSKQFRAWLKSRLR